MGSTDNPFTEGVYDPEMLALLTAVFNEAWADLVAEGYVNAGPEVARRWLATRIRCAVSQGVLDPEKLRAIALGKASLKP